MEDNSALKVRSDLYPNALLEAYEKAIAMRSQHRKDSAHWLNEPETDANSSGLSNANNSGANNSNLDVTARIHDSSANEFSVCASNHPSTVKGASDNNPHETNLQRIQHSVREIVHHCTTERQRSSSQSPKKLCPSPRTIQNGGQPITTPPVLAKTDKNSSSVNHGKEKPASSNETKDAPLTSAADPGGGLSGDAEGNSDQDEDDRIDVVTNDDTEYKRLEHEEVAVPKTNNFSSVCSAGRSSAPEFVPRTFDLHGRGALTNIVAANDVETAPAVKVSSNPPGQSSYTRTQQQILNVYENRPNPPLSETSGIREATLDLSTSSRCCDQYPPLSHQKPSTSPTISPSSPFSSFGIFPSLSRFQELNPIFREGFESGLKPPPYNPALYAANLPSHFLPWFISSQIQNLVHVSYQARSEDNLSIGGNVGGGVFLEEKEQQPLDLSAKKLSVKPLSDDDLVSRVLEIKPSTRGRRRADNSKRTYTEDELHAALRDIQSGKLGTRRAAVIYGIPRSTLRNKVYKMAVERDKQKKLMEQSERITEVLPDSTVHLPSGFHHSAISENADRRLSSCKALKTMIRNKMTEKLEELNRSCQAFLTGGEKERLLDSSLAYLFDNIPNLALNPENKSVPSDVVSSLSFYPQLNEFTQRIIEDRFHEEILRTKCRMNGSLLPDQPNGYKPVVEDHGIHVPSYPPTSSLFPDKVINDLGSSQSSVSSPPPESNLKEMIAQIINQKILNDEASPETTSSPKISETMLPIPVQHLDSSFSKSSINVHSDERSQQNDQGKKRSKSPSTGGGGKGSRPKRGKYRNYDRDNLLKAVQAVQSGEMSVHRAGSFYGVPHSTLEYKVKERHLNRGRNKKDSNALSTVPSTLFKNDKNAISVDTALSSNTLVKDHYKNETTDTTTLDINQTDNRCVNDEISVIRIQPSAPKKLKLSNESKDRLYPSSLPIATNPFLSSPFPFWNSTSPILAPFLTNHYQGDSMYASQMVRDLQEKLRQTSDSGNSSPSPNLTESKYSDIFLRNSPIAKAQQGLANGDSPSPSPAPSSPIMNEGLLNSLLRRRLDSSTANRSPSPSWTITSVASEQRQDGSNDTAGEARNSQHHQHPSPPASVVPPTTGLFTLNAFLPSFLAARSSLAAAIGSEVSNQSNFSNLSESSPPEPVAMSLVKRASCIPLVGPQSSETP